MKRWTIATRPTFPSRHPLGIPELLPQEIPLPSRLALRPEESGSGSLVIDRTLTPLPGSTIGFYVDDYRFEPLWSRPQFSLDRLLASQPAALIEPDFSLYSDHPLAVSIWNLYRSRWLARWWQERGVKVIPSLCWSPQTYKLATAGIPFGSVVAVEGRPRFKDPVIFRKGLWHAIKEIDPSAILMYGCDESLRKSLPDYLNCIWLPAWSPKRRMASLA